MKEVIAALLEKEINLEKEKIEKMVERPKEDGLGDFSFPCFPLAKKLKKDPKQIAKDLSKELSKKIKEIDELEGVEATNGYLNFMVNLSRFTSGVLDKIGEKGNENGKVVIDFSSPNIGKPLHVGHVRSTILGDSMNRIYKFLGWETYGINYINDEGLHIGKLVEAYKLWGEDKKIGKNPEKELLNLYVKYCKKEKLDAGEELEKSPSQEDNEDKDNKWARKAKQNLKKLEEGDKELKEIWGKIKKYSLEGFNRAYDRLDVEFDEIVGSSKFSKKGKEMVKLLLKEGLAYESDDGAAIAKLEEEDLPDKVVLRNDKTALYSTQDLGAAVLRHENHNFDKMIYVVGDEQRLYFKQLFKIFEKIGYEWASSLEHLAFGLFNLETGKISSREGNVIFLQDVIDRAKEEALKEIEEKSPELENKEKVAEKVGVAALKYSVLSKEPIKNMEFSFKNAINFEGDTGPYLQYSHARANSILEKANSKGQYQSDENFDPAEIKLIKTLDQFKEKVRKARQNLNPALIANYSYKLSKIFNEFYHKCKVIGSEKEEFRLKLVSSFKRILKISLELLGIEPLGKM